MRDTIIPQLRQKFRLLVNYGHFPNLDAIASALGKKQGTIESWADGGDRWDPGKIPKGSYKNLLKLFEKATARHHQVNDIETALKGRTVDLEECFKPQPAITLTKLIDSEAVTDRGVLEKVTTGPIGLVVVSNKPPPNIDYTVSQGESFRIKFQKAGLGKHIIVLQNAQQNWGFVSSVLNAEQKEILVPGFEEHGSLADMSEHDWSGPNRFIAIQVASHFPRKILVAVENNSAPDSILLQEIAKFYSAQPFEKRKLFVLTVRVKKATTKDRG